jgi:hypothetical protein
MGVFTRLKRGIEAFMHADTPDGDLVGVSDLYDSWSMLAARRLRYAMAWASYQNTSYRDIHRWARELRRDLGLYRWTRSIYNPTYRLAEFYVTHVLGGQLDPLAGDGKGTPSCLPILTENEAIRPALAAGWLAGNWQTEKDIAVRYGALFGDVGLKVVDDAGRGRVYLDVVHPKHVKHIVRDRSGNVREYVIEERRVDPRGSRPAPGEKATDRKVVTYEEHCFRDGQDIVYRTYLIDDAGARSWDWSLGADGGSAAGRPEWSVPYGFVPLVWIEHIPVKLGYGLSEAHSAGPKIREADDLASVLHDAARKAVNPAWLFAGVNKGADPLRKRAESEDEYARHSRANDSGKAEELVLYGPSDAKVQPIIAPLDIAATLEALRDQFDQIERDFPELRFDRLRAAGDVSGEALRVAREPAEMKARQRRAQYDDGLVRAQKMMLSVGGYRYRETSDPALKANLEAFAPFGLESYASGDLDHAIGTRPVFDVSEWERLDLQTKRYTAIELGRKAGLPRKAALIEAGYSEADAERIDREAESEAEKNMERAAKLAKPPAANQDPSDGNLTAE